MPKHPVKIFLLIALISSLYIEQSVAVTDKPAYLNKKAFSKPQPSLSLKQRLDFRVGQAVFEKIWISAPSASTATDGLGPLYNARACHQCHINNGRGHPPQASWPKDNALSLVLQLSVPAKTAAEKQALAEGKLANIPEPVYGQQLQEFAVRGLPAEGHIVLSYTELPVTLADGTKINLRKPSFKAINLAYGPLAKDTMFSARVAPSIIGLGLLDRIKAEDILKRADPSDTNKDGISGKANLVWNPMNKQTELGRFGWKAGQPSLEIQNNKALNTDIGISNPHFKNPYSDCTKKQTACLQMPEGNTKQHQNLEASSVMTQALLKYVENIAVPKARNSQNTQVLAGKKIFQASGCESCHRASFVLAKDNSNKAQIIKPYTDLLLHDMGSGLADNRPEFKANGQEWRTAPLWGIGLTKTVSGHTYFLHDGRARNLLEAILWHAGEAQSSRDIVTKLSQQERNQLILFLESL